MRSPVGAFGGYDGRDAVYLTRLKGYDAVCLKPCAIGSVLISIICVCCCYGSALTAGHFCKSDKSKKTLCSRFGPTASGSLTPATLRGHAANGHPWPRAASAASMPRCPLRAACVRPAPKSRCVVSGLAWMKNKSEARAALDRSHAPRGNAAPDAPRPMTQSVMTVATTRSVGAISNIQTDQGVSAPQHRSSATLSLARARQRLQGFCVSSKKP
jgi:hypothetical protein